jgi:hypothetical protein
MAILTDYRTDAATPLKLSIRWQRVLSAPASPYDLLGEMAIGLYIGDEPLFASAVYDPARMRRCGLRPGEFSSDSDCCQILRDVAHALKSGERVVIEDSVCLFTRVVIGPDLFAPDPRQDADAEFFDVLVLIDHGGMWHGDGLGGSGPAALLSVTREQLEQFWRDLTTEAMDPAASDEGSRERLKKDIGAGANQGSGA